MEVNSATYLEFKLLFFKLFFIKKIKKAPINGLPESVNTLLEETAETAGRIPEFDDSLMEDPLRGQCLLSID